MTTWKINIDIQCVLLIFDQILPDLNMFTVLYTKDVLTTAVVRRWSLAPFSSMSKKVFEGYESSKLEEKKDIICP